MTALLWFMGGMVSGIGLTTLVLTLIVMHDLYEGPGK